MGTQSFKTTDVLRLDVENTPTGLVNVIRNPSGDLGGWGWLTPIASTQMRGVVDSGYTWLTYTPANPSAANNFTTEPFAVAAGQYAAARWAQVGFFTRVRFEWLNSSGGLISSSTQSGYNSSGSLGSGGTVSSYAAVQAPVGTVRARFRFDVYQNTSGGNPIPGGFSWLREVTVATSATSGALAGLGYVPDATYTNVLGPTHSISIKRDELNVGTLTAEMLDATLDPSQATIIRPGKRVRLMATNAAASGAWTPLFTGKISKGHTTYDLTRTDSKKARITLTALDNASALAQVKRSAGVATIAELPYVLEGAGVPWSVNGSGNQVTNATVVTNNSDATALDQVAVTRDSVLGFAWVDRSGIAQVWDRASISTTVAATLSESVYSDLDLDYDTDRCINAVTVKLRRVNLANGQTVEVSYGPYVDQASIDQWGPHSAEFTVHGITDSDAAASAYATTILTANATPAVRINRATFPIRTTADVSTTRALLDLYDLVTVSNTNAAISTNMRATGIEHKITPEKWTVGLDFTVANSVAPPQVTPDLPSPVTTDGGWTNVTFNAGWGNLGFGWRSGQYRKVGSQVFLRGLIVRSGANVGAGSSLFTLPVGFRPTGANGDIVGVRIENPGPVQSNQELRINNVGDVFLQTAGINTNGWVSLGNTYFFTD